MKHLIDIMELSTQELEELIACAEDIIANPAKYAQACRGKKLATLFFRTVHAYKTEFRGGHV
jgi:aspartate carbamoyltransferase catalytic subunit